MIFQTVILQRAHHVSGVQAIQRQIVKCLDAREAGQNHTMVKETACKCEKFLFAYRNGELEEQHAWTFHSLVLCVKLRTTV